jgi:hypothetical protein
VLVRGSSPPPWSRTGPTTRTVQSESLRGSTAPCGAEPGLRSKTACPGRVDRLHRMASLSAAPALWPIPDSDPDSDPRLGSPTQSPDSEPRTQWGGGGRGRALRTRVKSSWAQPALRGRAAAGARESRAPPTARPGPGRLGQTAAAPPSHRRSASAHGRASNAQGGRTQP